MKREANRPVAEALGRWLDVKNIRRVVRLSGIGRSMLYDWMCEKYPIPAWALPRLFNAVPDIEAMSEALGLHDLGLVLSRIQKTESAPDIRDAVLRVSAETGELARLAADAVADGVLTEDEKRALRQHVDADERRLEELRRMLEPAPLRVAKPK